MGFFGIPASRVKAEIEIVYTVWLKDAFCQAAPIE